MEEIDLKELWNYFVSKIYILIIFIITCMLIGNVYLLCFQKPLYKSTTSLVLVSESNNNQSITQNDVILNNNLVTTYSEIIKSRNILSKVISNLKLNISVEQLSSSITVTSVTNTQLIKITVSDENNSMASKVANEIAKVFSKEITNIYKIQNISIVDKAVISDNPYNINPIKQNVVYFIIGLILGCGIIFVMFYFDTSIKDSKTIEEKLNLTVLGVVPKVGDNNVKR